MTYHVLDCEDGSVGQDVHVDGSVGTALFVRMIGTRIK